MARYLLLGGIMTDEPYDFDEQLEFGKNWEQIATEHLNDLFFAMSSINIDYDQYPDLQRAGIDSILQQEQATIDIKTQSHNYINTGNLPIEMVSVLEEGVPGWFVEADSDMVVWVYPNKAKTNLYKTGYLMPLTEGVRNWVYSWVEDAPVSRFIKVPNTGSKGDYHTGNWLVPIDKFPDEYLVEFDPRLPTDRETPQSDIMEWVNS